MVMKTPRIGIAGISGRMGQLLAAAIPAAGATLAGGTRRGDDLAALARASDVVIDFTIAAAIAPHAAILAQSGTAWVLGTTGQTDHDHAAIEAAAQHIPVFTAANFAPGVNLVLALAQILAAQLPAASHDAEVLEMHHRQKRDAPSGTALALTQAIQLGRGSDAAIPTASLRGGQIIGSHTALFTAGFEQITLTHHALDRRIFADGAVRAALWLTSRPPGHYGMNDMLALDDIIR
ncbi:MAG TPA: dihydrodipicolinate reductase C-terminal domain-containing protein [Acidiphilium sp.]|nr:MAG: 4-hydroxy-tetrahydrodipicolinate reductase [Acidiphilium sp. 21-60-14]OYV90554.1 MAG: 4-hydroxy-tetrahydrodipicolinate reductase [Acidiphilium sp. 37-60-79]OZB41479.1 MAG: 4-hydroxy-tetrahydrodipicolinate reductase [Acidiphilium sp. 34-60-192]HQT87581.1 dihydrodipicolinate reductase C-terminal domain-containing protein [Acidiphilium sp.]HQU24638.1 dihydrodipicolinate reductase C-terminal domain-containing protein [Acidiphilium sp.]